MAYGFSEGVLGTLAANWKAPNTINVFPLVVPKTIEQNGSQKILEDISTVTGSPVYNAINNPITSAKLTDLGPALDYFESYRTRSTIVGIGNSLAVEERVETLKVLANHAISVLDRSYIEERIGKLTGGIAKLIVVGSSHGDLRERRDRAEDAIMAVRGAIKHGVFPAGGWALNKAMHALIEAYPANNTEEVNVVYSILLEALEEPIVRLLANIGMSHEEIKQTKDELFKLADSGTHIFDAWNSGYKEAFEAGLLDSAPAVIEAIRNSISIASLLGTLGGAVVFRRDRDFERKESSDIREYINQVENPEHYEPDF
jgi:chaperonin GroEL